MNGLQKDGGRGKVETNLEYGIDGSNNEKTSVGRRGLGT